MFVGKVVIVTGGSSGIGADTATEFARLGADVIITGRNVKNLEHVANQCEDISLKNKKPLIIVADMNNEKDIENIIKITIGTFKRLDVLVNNAGILEFGSIETTSLDQYDCVMTTNVRSVYHLTMLAVPHLIESKGNIVNVSSVGGMRSFLNILAYCISKSALDQFTKCVALELAAKGVRVNAVNPGVIATNLLKTAGLCDEENSEFLENSRATHPLGRPGEVREVSSAIVFLSSDAASNITGATLPVDGGKHALCPR